MKRILAIGFICLLAVTNYSAAEADTKYGDLGFSLSPSLRRLILGPKNVYRIMQIRKIESFARSVPIASGADEGFVIVAIDLSLEGDFRIEGAWHGRMCFVRRFGERSWENAIELYLPRAFEVEDFRSMGSDELEDFITKHRRPSIRVEVRQ